MDKTEYFNNTEESFKGVDLPKKYVSFIGEDFKFEWSFTLVNIAEKKGLLTTEDQKFMVSSFAHFVQVNNLFHCRNLFKYITKKMELFNYMGVSFVNLMIKKFKQKKKHLNKDSKIAEHQLKVFNLKYKNPEIESKSKHTDQEKYPNMVGFKSI
jgi:hypothetical protein